MNDDVILHSEEEQFEDIAPHVAWIILFVFVVSISPVLVGLRVLFRVRNTHAPIRETRRIRTTATLVFLTLLLTVAAIVQGKYLIFHAHGQKPSAFPFLSPLPHGLIRAQVFFRIYVVAVATMGALAFENGRRASFYSALSTLGGATLMFLAPRQGTLEPFLWSAGTVLFLFALKLVPRTRVSLVLLGQVLVMMVACHVPTPKRYIPHVLCLTYGMEASVIGILFYTPYGLEHMGLLEGWDSGLPC